MEDKRVTKTKKNVKDSFIKLLTEKPFDDITVTELCDTAGMSRITFYTHYSDKYELTESLFQELMQIVQEEYENLQKSNPDNDPMISYCNLLDSVISLYESNTVFLRQLSQRRNPYLYYSFYNHIIKRIETIFSNSQNAIHPRVGTKKFTAFICNGLWAYINACYNENCDISQIREETKLLLTSMLNSEIFVKDKN
jgi:AcrR family transcriptional regulator